MYEKSIHREHFNHSTFVDENGEEQSHSVLAATATLARVVLVREDIVNKATARVSCCTGDGAPIPEMETWVTTDIPAPLLLMFRRVVSNTAPQNEVDYIHEIILNSPEGNAVMPTVASNSLPQLDQFKTAILEDVELSPSAKSNLILRYPLIDAYAHTQPSTVAAAWAVLKASGETWLTPEVVARVESIAEQYNVPMVI